MLRRHQKDGTFYVQCDDPKCKKVLELHTTDEDAALRILQHAGFYRRKNSKGDWVTFDSIYCEICYRHPEFRYYRTRLMKVRDNI